MSLKLKMKKKKLENKKEKDQNPVWADSYPIWPISGRRAARPKLTYRARPGVDTWGPLVNLFSRAHAHYLTGMWGPLDSFTPRTTALTH
jgi:hypothetical protein